MCRQGKKWVPHFLFVWKGCATWLPLASSCGSHAECLFLGSTTVYHLLPRSGRSLSLKSRSCWWWCHCNAEDRHSPGTCSACLKFELFMAGQREKWWIAVLHRIPVHSIWSNPVFCIVLWLSQGGQIKHFRQVSKFVSTFSVPLKVCTVRNDASQFHLWKQTRNICLTSVFLPDVHTTAYSRA